MQRALKKKLKRKGGRWMQRPLSHRQYVTLHLYLIVVLLCLPAVGHQDLNLLPVAQHHEYSMHSKSYQPPAVRAPLRNVDNDGWYA